MLQDFPHYDNCVNCESRELKCITLMPKEAEETVIQTHSMYSHYEHHQTWARFQADATWMSYSYFLKQNKWPLNFSFTGPSPWEFRLLISEHQHHPLKQTTMYRLICRVTHRSLMQKSVKMAVSLWLFSPWLKTSLKIDFCKTQMFSPPLLCPLNLYKRGGSANISMTHSIPLASHEDCFCFFKTNATIIKFAN